MDNAEKIENYRKLYDEKRKLEEQLEITKDQILELKRGCKHTTISMKHLNYYYPSSCEFICLFCGKVLERPSTYNIDVRGYLTKYDEHNIKQREEKFDEIQTLALGILRDNPEMSEETLVLKFNKLIRESLNNGESEIGRQLVKAKKN